MGEGAKTSISNERSLYFLNISRTSVSFDCSRVLPKTPFGSDASTITLVLQLAFSTMAQRPGKVTFMKDASERATKIKQDTEGKALIL